MSEAIEYAHAGDGDPIHVLQAPDLWRQRTACGKTLRDGWKRIVRRRVYRSQLCLTCIRTDASLTRKRMTTTTKMSKAEKIHLELLQAQRGRTYKITIKGIEHPIRDGWVPSTVLQELGGWRYSARLYDLSRQGIEHESQQYAGGLWLYRIKPAEGAATAP
jgi:hypothetical protein